MKPRSQGRSDSPHPAGNGVCSPDVLEQLAARLARTFRHSVPDPPAAFDVRARDEPGAANIYSTAILQRWSGLAGERGARARRHRCDLYVPVLTFVFGEAQLEGNCAVVSTARLHEEFYGMPASDDLLGERLLKEAVHELGHTFGLRHCADWRVRHVLEPRGGAAGREGCGVLRVL